MPVRHSDYHKHKELPSQKEKPNNNNNKKHNKNPTEVSDKNLKYCIFLGGLYGKESACNAGDLVSISRSGTSPGEGNGYLLQYSCLAISMDRGAWWATVHEIARVGLYLIFY